MKKLICFLVLFPMVLGAQKSVEVYFDFNKFDLTTEATTKIDSTLLNFKDAEVSKIYGFCDSKGSNAYNDTLSLKRVDAVYRYLQGKGVKIRQNYELKGLGEDFKQSEVQSENRKVLIVFEMPEPPPAPPKPAVNSLTDQVKVSKKGDKIKLQHINFKNNSAVVVPKSLPVLNELLCIMEDNPKLKIEIQGHICCQRKADVNDVSTARARAIYNYLIKNKVNRSRISFKGFGTSRPIFPIPEKSEEEEDVNRRVEIMIVEN